MIPPVYAQCQRIKQWLYVLCAVIILVIFCLSFAFIALIRTVLVEETHHHPTPTNLTTEVLPNGMDYTTLQALENKAKGESTTVVTDRNVNGESFDHTTNFTTSYTTESTTDRTSDSTTDHIDLMTSIIVNPTTNSTTNNSVTGVMEKDSVSSNMYTNGTSTDLTDAVPKQRAPYVNTVLRHRCWVIYGVFQTDVFADTKIEKYRFWRLDIREIRNSEPRLAIALGKINGLLKWMG